MLIEKLIENVNESAESWEFCLGHYRYSYALMKDRTSYEQWLERWSTDEDFFQDKKDGYTMSCLDFSDGSIFLDCPNRKVFFISVFKRSERDILLDDISKDAIVPLIISVQSLQLKLAEAQDLYDTNMPPIYEKLRKRVHDLEMDCEIVWHKLKERLRD